MKVSLKNKFLIWLFNGTTTEQRLIKLNAKVDRLKNELSYRENQESFERKVMTSFKKDIDKCIERMKEIDQLFHSSPTLAQIAEHQKSEQLNEKLNITIVAYQKMKQEYQEMKKEFERLNK